MTDTLDRMETPSQQERLKATLERVATYAGVVLIVTAIAVFAFGQSWDGAASYAVGYFSGGLLISVYCYFRPRRQHKATEPNGGLLGWHPSD
ncbi:MAG: hypothetical protein JWO88_1992 [Frankiales bacterium]|nr:hypothetical protein [Frankiales bacterium]